MTITNSVQEIFEDARQLYRAAIERLEAGDVRDAAEKAWCATLRATNALIVSQGGHEPERSPQTSRELDRLAENDQRIKSLVGRYYSRQSRLHGDSLLRWIVSRTCHGTTNPGDGPLHSRRRRICRVTLVNSTELILHHPSIIHLHPRHATNAFT